MKRILVALAVCAALGVAHGQISPVQLIVQPQTKKRGAGSGWYWRDSNDSRTLHIIVKNLSAQPINELTVRWGIVKMRIGSSNTRGPREAAYGAEEKFDLKPTTQKEIDTPYLDVHHHDWHASGTYYGEKITGHGAQVLLQGKVIAEQFTPPGIKPLFDKLKPMPKDEEETRPSKRR